MRTVTHDVGTSPDGYIAAPDGSYDVFPGAGIPVIAAPRPGALPFSPVDHRVLAEGTTITTYHRTPST